MDSFVVLDIIVMQEQGFKNLTIGKPLAIFG